MTEISNEFAQSWRILLGSFLGVGFGVTSLYFYSAGIFFKPLASEFGWTRGAVSLGSMFGTLATILGAIIVGRLVDKYNAVYVGLFSLFSLSIGFFCLSKFVFGLYSYIIIVAATSFFAIASTGLAFARPIISSFHRHRGLALGVMLTGAGLGGILVPRLLTPYVAEHGWRDGYQALSIISFLVIPVIWFVFGRQIKQTNVLSKTSTSINSKLILSQKAFYLIGVIFMLASVSVIGTVIHFIPLLTDQGLSPAKAGGIASLIGFAAIFGRLFAGFLIDRLPAGLVTFGLFLTAACGLLIVALIGNSFLVIGALIIGLAIGAEIDLLTYFTGKYFPERMFGQAYGLLFALFSVGAAIGPVLYGYLFDRNENYDLAMIVGAFLLALSACVALYLDRFNPELV